MNMWQRANIVLKMIARENRPAKLVKAEATIADLRRACPDGDRWWDLFALAVEKRKEDLGCM
jgi:hypothetical protein